MKVLENTPAVLSLGKLCDEHGYSYEWINGQKSHFINNGVRIQCNAEKFVPIVVPGLSASCSSSLPSSTSMTLSKQEIDHLLSSSRSSPSPTMTSFTVSSKSVTRVGWIPVPRLCRLSVLKDKNGEPCSSGTQREQLLTKSTRSPKPNQNKNHDQKLGDPCHL